MHEYTDVRVTAKSDADWQAADQVLLKLSKAYDPYRPRNRGVWHHFRPDGFNKVPVTLGVWLAGDVKAQVQASLAEMAPPHLRDRFMISIKHGAYTA